MGSPGAPALVWSLRPQVVLVKNGPRKGFSNSGYDTIKSIMDLEDIWQGHRGEANDEAHNTTEEKIANLSPSDDKGYWIKASIATDGSYTVTNARYNITKSYTAR